MIIDTWIELARLRLLVASTLVLGIAVAMATPLHATRESRPFWTEKSSFIEGDELFVVGVASHARSVEEARKQAFENGKIELMNYAQITNLEARGLVIETQMTYEEPNPDNTVTVYRLLRVPVGKLVGIQGRLQDETRIQEHTLDQARRELAATQESVLRRQQELESKGKELETAVVTVSRLHVTLGEKALEIEQQQKQVEQLLRKLSTKVMSEARPGASNPVFQQQTGSSDSLLKRLEETESSLDAEATRLSEIRQRVVDRMQQEKERNERRCRMLVLGMTKQEAMSIMGKPDSQPDISDRAWNYGNRDELKLWFHSSGGLSSVKGCS